MFNVHILPVLLAICLAWPGGLAQAAPPDPDAVHISLPRHRIQPHELAVIVNDNDPLSVRIAAYYIDARAIPADNLIHVKIRPDAANLDAVEFARIRKAIDAATAAHIQAYAITWVTPYRVDCMSITSAIAFGFDKSWCSHKLCASTRHSPYFGYRGAMPFRDLGMRPTMSIAATGFAAAKALIDTGIRSDNTHPPGTAYLLSTSDKARNIRAAAYARVRRSMQGWIDTRIIESDTLRDRDDVLFYFTGKTRVAHLDTLTFRPGAIADHLTSTGGKLVGGKQMSALRWLEAGASGSFGTVTEPCNLPGKFPQPGAVMERYGSGRTLMEAYWQSVQQPGEGLFIGEPLAAPFDGIRHSIAGQRIILRTRTLLPGIYRLQYAQTPVGPYRTLSQTLQVRPRQQEIALPLLGAGYYRVTPAP